MDIEEKFNAARGRGRPIKHPFAKMKVGQIVEVQGDPKKMQIYAHSYGNSSGRKFITRTVDGVLYVKRAE